MVLLFLVAFVVCGAWVYYPLRGVLEGLAYLVFSSMIDSSLPCLFIRNGSFGGCGVFESGV